MLAAADRARAHCGRRSRHGWYSAAGHRICDRLDPLSDPYLPRFLWSTDRGEPTPLSVALGRWRGQPVRPPYSTSRIVAVLPPVSSGSRSADSVAQSVSLGQVLPLASPSPPPVPIIGVVLMLATPRAARTHSRSSRWVVGLRSWCRRLLVLGKPRHPRRQSADCERPQDRSGALLWVARRRIGGSV